MASQFEAKYRFAGAVRLDNDTFNMRLRDIDQRLVSVEEGIANIDDAKDQLVQLGLESLQAAIANEIDGLQSLINSAQINVSEAEAQLAAIEGDLTALESAFNAIIAGGSLPAVSVSISAIPGVTAAHAQGALAEHQADIDNLGALIAAKAANIVVANATARNALTGLVRANTVFVENDDGSGNWALYVITAQGNGTWSGAAKTVVLTENHVHVVADVTGLQDALAGKADLTGDTFTGDLAITGGDVAISKAAGNVRAARYRTSGSDRWVVGADGSSESGSNAGSAFVVQRFSDAGALLATALSIARNNGDATFGAGVTAASYDTASDRRLKTRIKRFTLDRCRKVLDLVPSSFRLKGRPDDGDRLGFIAQDVAHHLPEAVREREDGMLTIDYDAVVSALLGLVKDQERRLAGQDRRIVALETALAAR